MTDAPDVARAELRQFLHMAEWAGMDADCQCRSLRLSRDDWQNWLGILRDAPLPPSPALPLLLRRLGTINSWLDHVARRRAAYA
jgi:hypothetical protein